MTHEVITLLTGGGAGAVIVKGLEKAADIIRTRMHLPIEKAEQEADADAATIKNLQELNRALQIPATDYTSILTEFMKAVKTNAELTAQVGRHEADLEHLRGDIASLRSQVGDLITQRDGLTGELASERTRATQAEARAAQAEVTAVRLQGENATLAADVIGLRHDLEIAHLQSETAARGQIMTEGALSQANRDIGAIREQKGG